MARHLRLHSSVRATFIFVLRLIFLIQLERKGHVWSKFGIFGVCCTFFNFLLSVKFSKFSAMESGGFWGFLEVLVSHYQGPFLIFTSAIVTLFCIAIGQLNLMFPLLEILGFFTTSADFCRLSTDCERANERYSNGRCRSRFLLHRFSVAK